MVLKIKIQRKKKKTQKWKLKKFFHFPCCQNSHRVKYQLYIKPGFCPAVHFGSNLWRLGYIEVLCVSPPTFSFTQWTKKIYSCSILFCYQNCSDLLCEEKISSDREKTFEIWGWRARICKFLQIFEILRAMYSTSEWSEQFFSNRMLFLTHI